MVHRKKDKVVARRIAGEMLLVPICGNLADMEKVFVLEGTGEAVWELIDGERSDDAISGQLAEECDEGIDLVSGDVHELMADLETAGLVEEVN